MKFRVGDKVRVESPGWNEECTVVKMGISRTIMFVHRTNGTTPAIYRSWASKIILKNEQLLFDFAYET